MYGGLKLTIKKDDTKVSSFLFVSRWRQWYNRHRYHSCLPTYQTWRKNMSQLTKIVLSEQDMPTQWYNLNADLPAAGVEMLPPLHPGTGQPIGPDDSGAALSDGSHCTGSEQPSAISISLKKCKISTVFGGPRRSIGRTGGRKRWIHRPRFTTRMRESALQVAISRTRRCHRPTTI